ncbi:hypothetical protein [Flexibacterium corallicola]|uniref:hypothetical protein n=1 Tax=Flexibacterium corallicola TaxID=3037259 RepID=UPI00286F1A04|nr:hypothetical protein [Pseudovibrio sp. M1P-2-3]
MPYTLTPAANTMAIAEREYGTAANQIQFTAFTSCIGVAVRIGNDVRGVHLTISGADGTTLFSPDIVPDVMAVLENNYTEAFIIGQIQYWEAQENGVSLAYADLVTAVSAVVVGGAVGANFTTYPLADGTYGAEVLGGHFSPTY